MVNIGNILNYSELNQNFLHRIGGKGREAHTAFWQSPIDHANTRTPRHAARSKAILLQYRTAPHTVTVVPSSELSFNLTVKGKLLVLEKRKMKKHERACEKEAGPKTN